MQRTMIFCLAFGIMLGIVREINAQNPENIADTMLFQEVKIALVGTAATKADYFAGKSPRAVIFAPGAMFSKESWHFLAARFQAGHKLCLSKFRLNSRPVKRYCFS